MGDLHYNLLVIIVATQQHSVTDLAFFIVYIYPYYWFAIPVSADVPFLTLTFWKDLKRWAVRDPALSSVCIKKLDMHTWYLSPRCILLSLFSNLVEEDMKSDIARALLQNPYCPVQMGKPDRSRGYEDSTLSSFVTGESWLIFKLVGIEPAVLCKLASTWGDDHSFVQLKPIVTSLKVINAAAERTVKLGSDFKRLSLKIIMQRPGILQQVERNRRMYPEATKLWFLKTKSVI